MNEQQKYKITKFYSKKEFKKYKEKLNKKGLNPIILGTINLNKKIDKEDKKDIVYINENKKDLYILEDKELQNIKVSKYGYVENEEFLPLFVQVKRDFYIWFLLLLISILSILLIIPSRDTKIYEYEDPKENLEIANGIEWDGELPQNGETSQADSGQIKIPCYSNLYLKKDEPLKLINPSENDVYFVYTIYENGEEIYKSKAIEPNKMVKSKLPKSLSVGEHNLIFEISTYDIQTKEHCNGAQMNVKLTIKESSNLENSDNIQNTEKQDIYLTEKDGKYYLPKI